MTDSVVLSEAAKALIDDRSFATVATIQPDGSPQLSVVWVTRDGDDLLFSTTESRRKAQNLVRDARVGVLLYPLDKPYTYLEIRGTAELETAEGRELIDALSQKYTGGPYTNDGPDAVRVVVRVKAHKVLDHLG